jgi:hypothetical protein
LHLYFPFITREQFQTYIGKHILFERAVARSEVLAKA